MPKNVITKAGAGLNKIIHSKIMGKCPHELKVYKKDNTDAFDDYTTYRCSKCKETFRGLMYSEGMLICPDYSRKMTDAWAVVEKMKELGFFYWIEYEGVHRCLFFKGEGGHYELDHAFAREQAFSICIAAVQAFEHWEEGKRVTEFKIDHSK